MNLDSYAASSLKWSGLHLTDTATTIRYPSSYSPCDNEVITATFAPNAYPPLAALMRDSARGYHYLVTDVVSAIPFKSATLAPVRGFAAISRNNQTVAENVATHISMSLSRAEINRDAIRQIITNHALIQHQHDARQGDTLTLNGVSYHVLGSTAADTPGLQMLQMQRI